ncbi:hypothetical protein C2E23DRAFT_736958 [Lenzites betulinus]|nr:hypothetical protein C2E23DRAFT_736958 [Lenzites betulinus]
MNRPADIGGDTATRQTQTLSAVVEEEEYAVTPTPTGGFPEIHHARPESLTEELAQRRVNDLWKQEQGRVALIHVVNVGYPSPSQKAALTVEITGLIRAQTGETNFVVIAPEPEWVEPPARRGTPRTWAALGLDVTSVANLVEKRILSSDWVSIIVYERKLVIPRYLFTLTGFTNNYDDNISAAVQETFASDPVLTSIIELTSEHPGLTDLAPDEAAALILSTLTVRIDKLNNGNLHAAVFCDSPTTSSSRWLEWRRNLMTLPFESQYNPTATARPLELCGCCHSADHVTHMCRLPSTPGWRAPQPETRMFGRPRQQAQTTAPMYGMGVGASQRGRGRGGMMSRGGRNYGQGRAPMYPGPPGSYLG